jgi:hypothetical protein
MCECADGARAHQVPRVAIPETPTRAFRFCRSDPLPRSHAISCLLVLVLVLVLVSVSSPVRESSPVPAS